MKALKAESEPSNQFGRYLNKLSCLLHDLVRITNKIKAEDISDCGP